METTVMNIPAALISSGVGAAFFGACYAYDYRPSFMTADHALFDMLATSQSKARAAVSRLLINPASAQFDGLRSVEANTAKYVCGKVKAKDQSGSYSGYRAFVYTVAIDFARIDDDGRIARKHDAFRACPILEEEEIAQGKTAISPGTLSMLKAIQKIIPANASSILAKIASQAPPKGSGSSGASMEQQLAQLAGQPSPGGNTSSGATMEQQLSQLADRSPPGGDPSSGASMGQQLGRLAGQSAPGGQQAKSASGTAVDIEPEWRSDQPPATWPMFPSDHPLAQPAAKRTPAQTIAFAQDVEDRWAQSRPGNAKARPSSEEIKEACRALLAIDPKSAEFPKAWATFVRLRKIDREAGQS
jgi:hypothetical protein